MKTLATIRVYLQHYNDNSPNYLPKLLAIMEMVMSQKEQAVINSNQHMIEI
jgi:hypothetical protein